MSLSLNSCSRERVRSSASAWRSVRSGILNTREHGLLQARGSKDAMPGPRSGGSDVHGFRRLHNLPNGRHPVAEHKPARYCTRGNAAKTALKVGAGTGAAA
jgi:hypothetical protein